MFTRVAETGRYMLWCGTPTRSLMDDMRLWCIFYSSWVSSNKPWLKNCQPNAGQVVYVRPQSYQWHYCSFVDRFTDELVLLVLLDGRLLAHWTLQGTILRLRVRAGKPLRLILQVLLASMPLKTLTIMQHTIWHRSAQTNDCSSRQSLW
jgi:hypothetical protein